MWTLGPDEARLVVPRAHVIPKVRAIDAAHTAAFERAPSEEQIMHDARSWMAAWQSLLPVVAGIVMLVTMKWLSRRWTSAAIARTARVTAKLRRRF
jgi:hypothetical protein